MEIRNGKAWRVAAVAAAAALVAGTAVAGEQRDRSHCDTGCGWQVQASGPSSCGPNKQNTCIRYTLTGEGVPDHFAVYLSVDLEVVKTSPGARSVDLCSKGDPAVKAAPNCHEKLVRFNSASGPFWIEVKGPHQKATTTAIVKKGNAVCASAIDGIGSSPAPPQQTACVNNCGSFDPHQQRRATETFTFKGCRMTFRYNDDGSVPEEGGFSSCTLDESGQYCTESSETCQAKQGSIDELNLYGGPDEGNTKGAFGDGWLNTGENSCATRLIGGRYYTTCY